MYPTKPLSQICKFQNWFAFKSELFKNEWFPILRISNIQDNNMSYNRLVYFDLNDYNVDLSKYIVSKWDLVIAMSWATTWKLAINNTDDEFYLNQRVWKFIFENDMTKNYIHYFLSTKIQENLHKSVWSAIPNLSTEQINNIQIPLPPLPTQKLIVQKLNSSFEKIDQSIELTRKNLQNLEELNKSVLEKVFSEWEYEKIYFSNKNYLEIIDWDRWVNYPKKIDFKEKWFCLFLNTSNVRQWFFDFSKMDFITEEKYNKMWKWKVFINDVILTTRWTIWNSVFVDINFPFEFARINSWMIILRNNLEKLNPKYLIYFINSPLFENQKNRFVSGSAQPQLHIWVMKSIYVPLPPLSKQKEIVTYLNEIFEKNKKLKEKYEDQLKDLEELKQSLLKEAFEGRLMIE